MVSYSWNSSNPNLSFKACPVQVSAAVLTITVHPCEVGQRPQDGSDAVTTQTCTLCPANTFSWNSSNPTCPPCPKGAQCNGGATVIPEQGYVAPWWGSPNMTLCPNPNACQRDMKAVAFCQNATFYNRLAAVQVSIVAVLKLKLHMTSLTTPNPMHARQRDVWVSTDMQPSTNCWLPLK